MPQYAVYRVDSFTGTTFQDDDVPDRLTFVTCCEAVNGEGAKRTAEVDGPAVAIRLTTLNVALHGA